MARNTATVERSEDEEDSTKGKNTLLATVSNHVKRPTSKICMTATTVMATNRNRGVARRRLSYDSTVSQDSMSGSTESLSDQSVKKEELNGDFFHDKFTSADAAASTLWEPEDMENSHSLIEGDPEDCFFVMSNNDILPATTLRRNVSRSSSQPTMDYGEDVTSGQQQQRRQSTTNVAAEEHSILSEENSATKTPRRNKDEKLADNSIVETGDDSFLASSFHLQLDSNIELPMNDSNDAFDPPRQRSRSLARSTSSSSKPQARAKSLKRRTGEAESTTKDRSSASTPLSNRRGRSIGRSSNQNSTLEQEAKHENEGRVSTTKTKVSTKMELSSSEHHTAPLHRRSRSTGRVSEEAKCIAADSSENSLQQRHSLSVKKCSQSAARPRGHGARRGSDNGASGSKRNDANNSDIKTDDSVETEKRSRSTALTSSRGRSRSVRRTSGGENGDESVKEVTSPPTRRSRSVHQSSTDVGTRSHSVKQRSTARETPDTTGSSLSSDQSSPQYRRSRSAARPSTRDSIQTSRRVTAPDNDAGSSGKETKSSLQKSRRSRSTARVSLRDCSCSVKRTAVKEDPVPPASHLL